MDFESFMASSSRGMLLIEQAAGQLLGNQTSNQEDHEVLMWDISLIYYQKSLPTFRDEVPRRFRIVHGQFVE